MRMGLGMKICAWEGALEEGPGMAVLGAAKRGHPPAEGPFPRHPPTKEPKLYARKTDVHNLVADKPQI